MLYYEYLLFNYLIKITLQQTFQKCSFSDYIYHFTVCLCSPYRITWIPWTLSFRYILFHEKRLLNDAVTPQRQSQFTPKMKAKAVPRLLSSLVWIDQYNECNGMTSFMEFMWGKFQLTSCICVVDFGVYKQSLSS